MRWLIGQAENGSSRQRYKGLGNEPLQLGKPRLTRKVRLLKVQIDDAIEADRVHHAAHDEVAPHHRTKLRAGISIFDVFQV
jgi:DNA gyrase subunit B